MAKPAYPEFDGCQIVERLRSGPVADLYHAIQQPLGRPVLIKALSTSILPSSPFAATLEREARLLAELHHPNILQLFDFVRRDERMWLVLEYVDGWPLDELLARGEPLEPAAAAALTIEVARALEHSHKKGIVHRDIQPRNVVISRRGEVKLVGFTIAVDERSPSLPELLDGSAGPARPAYMSPEQILGEPADPRSDLFSLGVVLYEALSGTRPFDAADEGSTTQRIRHERPPPLARTAGPIPPSLERALLRCLEKLPSDRYASATDLRRALESVLAELGGPASDHALLTALRRQGLPVQAPPRGDASEPLLSRGPGRFSLTRFVLGLGAAFTLVVIGAGVVYVVARGEGAANSRGAAARLELVPNQTAYLRVVADPWAHVIVDGQKVATTPFARPIPLAAGTHYVRLEHPDAPPERRTVELAPGENVLLDVKMNVSHVSPPPDSAEFSGDSGVTDAATDALPSP